jgi:hypothetical protein
MNLIKLKREARAIAKAKGHTLTKFNHSSLNVHEAWCTVCKRKILIDFRGVPSNIWGSCFVLDCKASRFAEDWSKASQLAAFKWKD